VSVVDASVLIAHFAAHDAHHAPATAHLASTADLWIGPLNLAEVLVAPARGGRLADVAEAVEKIGVEEVPMPPQAAAQLAELRARTGLSLPDCCVLLTAQQTGGAVATFDDRLRRAAVGLGLAAVAWPSHD
jgi:predicted nucleic acid-binding protein